MNLKFEKPYQVWQSDGNWYFTEFDTLKEAIESVKYGEYYITKSVDFEIKELTKPIKAERKE